MTGSALPPVQWAGAGRAPRRMTATCHRLAQDLRLLRGELLVRQDALSVQPAELGQLVHLNAAESGGGTGGRLPLRSLCVERLLLCLFELCLLVGRGPLLGVFRFRVVNRAAGDDG